MKLDDRHYETILYVYDKMLEWNCWTNKERGYIMKQKDIAIKKKNNLN